MYLFVDAAYAGSFTICEEYTEYIAGLELADGYVFNPSKMMLCGMDATFFFIGDTRENAEAFGVDPESDFSLSEI